MAVFAYFNVFFSCCLYLRYFVHFNFIQEASSKVIVEGVCYGFAF